MFKVQPQYFSYCSHRFLPAFHHHGLRNFFPDMVGVCDEKNKKILVRNRLDTTSGNLEKVSSSNRIHCPVKTGLSVQLLPDSVSNSNRIGCPVYSGFCNQTAT